MLTLALAAAVLLAQPADPEDRALIERAAAVAPSARQVAWQRLELEGFLHFGMNTFTGREWGEGTEDPRLFDPTDLDADQWASVAADAGMKALVLVAKHHDGFCLWPSALTEHSVKHSAWRGGKGDVVREVSEACKRHGLKFGVYLSPADLHEPSYGKSDAYNRFFLGQLRELLTQYGPVHEVWFDGATPRDKGQVYDYQAWYALIRELQPEAVIFGRGPDVRWVGNEAGKGRASEWSVVPLPVPAEGFTWPDMTEADLGSLARLKAVEGGKYLHWYPAETDTSIRPGWFWHEGERARTLDDLLNVYYASVGNNCVLLLNMPPDARGRIADGDVARLHEFGATLRATFGQNLAAGAAAVASAEVPEHPPAAAMDGKPETYWTTKDWPGETTFTVMLPKAQSFNVVMLQEHIGSGQRVEGFTVEAWDPITWAAGGSGWRELGSGTTIGYKRLVRAAEPVLSDRVRVRFAAARVRPTLAEFGLYLEPVRLGAPSITRDRAGMVTMKAQPEAGAIVYTLDGTEPGAGAAKYDGPFPLPKGGSVRARAVAKDAAKAVAPGQVGAAEFDVCKAKWKVAAVSSEQPDAGEGAANAIDDDAGTIWHTRYMPDTPKQPHRITIDLGETLNLRGFTYLPRQNGPNGRVVRYECSTSEDGESWGEGAKGEFANQKNNPTEQRVVFQKPRPARFLRFVALSEVNGQAWGSAAEIGVITRP